MTERLQVYKCEICGNIVEVVHTGVGELVCCGQPMRLLEEKTKEEGGEKHLPVMEKTENGIKVKVGSISHPMERKHYIEWIEVQTAWQTYRRFLQPGGAPEAEFEIDESILKVRGYCNIHELWAIKK